MGGSSWLELLTTIYPKYTQIYWQVFCSIFKPRQMIIFEASGSPEFQENSICIVCRKRDERWISSFLFVSLNFHQILIFWLRQELFALPCDSISRHLLFTLSALWRIITTVTLDHCNHNATTNMCFCRFTGFTRYTIKVSLPRAQFSLGSLASVGSLL